MLLCHTIFYCMTSTVGTTKIFYQKLSPNNIIIKRLLIDQITLNPPPEPETVCLTAKMNVRKSSINVKKY